jgi:4-hydroxy-tetrahydrodipicolinate synthase
MSLLEETNMITGSIVALVTPMHQSNKSIDWVTLEKLVDWHVTEGTDAIVAVGTTGESATLNVSEHASVIEFVVSKVAGRVPVIAGTGANATDEAIHLSKAAKDVGADACLLVTPYYNKPTQGGLYEHFCAISDAVDIDQILYNVPSRTACDILPETVLKLSSRPNIVGIKEATGDLERARILLNSVPSNFAVYSGDDATARELMLLGGHGDISVTANVAPRMMSEMCAEALKGDFKQALVLDKKLAPLHEALFLEANPIPVKWALSEMGMIESQLRLPMTELSIEHHTQVRQALECAGVI